MNNAELFQAIDHWVGEAQVDAPDSIDLVDVITYGVQSDAAPPETIASEYLTSGWNSSGIWHVSDQLAYTADLDTLTLRRVTTA